MPGVLIPGVSVGSIPRVLGRGDSGYERDQAEYDSATRTEPRTGYQIGRAEKPNTR